LKLLIDNQLPIALAWYLVPLGWAAVHVSNLGLDTATDHTIWKYARDNHLVIVTKDQDFSVFAKQQARIPPQVLWVRLGNCRRQALFDAFTRESSRLRRQLAAGAPVVELG
jgi:predicted nuclease of predicted toxin-antitoxin system